MNFLSYLDVLIYWHLLIIYFFTTHHNFIFFLLVAGIYTAMIGLWIAVYQLYLYYGRILLLDSFQCIKISCQFLYPPFVPILSWIVFIKFKMKFGNYDLLCCQLVPKLLAWNYFLFNVILKFIPLSHGMVVFILLG